VEHRAERDVAMLVHQEAHGRLGELGLLDDAAQLEVAVSSAAAERVRRPASERRGGPLVRGLPSLGLAAIAR
jgi:hypothetical protein